MLGGELADQRGHVALGAVGRRSAGALGCGAAGRRGRPGPGAAASARAAARAPAAGLGRPGPAAVPRPASGSGRCGSAGSPGSAASPASAAGAAPPEPMTASSAPTSTVSSSLDLDLQQRAGDRRRDLGVDLVGGDLEQRLVDRDLVADLLEPAGDGALGDATRRARAASPASPPPPPPAASAARLSPRRLGCSSAAARSACLGGLRPRLVGLVLGLARELGSVGADSSAGLAGRRRRSREPPPLAARRR